MTSTSTSTAVRPDTTAARPQRAWQDGLNLALGVYLALAPLWTAGAPAAWFVTLGILIAAAAAWALGTASSTASEGVQIALGAVTFLSPWLGGFATATAAAWTAWIVGVAVIVLAATALATARRTRA